MSEDKDLPMKGILIEKITLENICGTSTQAATSCWAPRREEIQRFVELAKYVHQGPGKPRILDVGCGTGFLSYLLALTGEVEVIGIDPEEERIKNSPYSHPNLKLEVGDARDAVKKYRNEGDNDDLFFLFDDEDEENTGVDVVLNSWMPEGVNLTPDIRRINAPCIIYVRDKGGSTGTDMNEDVSLSNWADQVSYDPGNDYDHAFSWSGHSMPEIRWLAQGMKKEDLTGFRQANIIEMQFRKGISLSEVPKVSVSESDKYSWEKELDRVGDPLEDMEEL